MLSKETIRQELDDITHKLQQKYHEKYIFGVFVLGNATYNLAEDIDELTYKLIDEEEKRIVFDVIRNIINDLD